MSSVYKPFCCIISFILLLTVRDAVSNRRLAESAKLARSRATPALPVLRVTSILEQGFLMRGSDAEGDFVGFIPDLLVRLSELVGFQYEIKLVSDGKYGEKMTDGLWNGMIGELTRREVDIAAGALTVTAERERVVDFTKPFMYYRVAAIMKERQSTQFNIHRMEDLGRQTFVKYGVVDSSAAKDFFRNSLQYTGMWSTMAEDPETGFVRTTAEGVRRMLASTDDRPWAFISDLAILIHEDMQRNDLTIASSEHFTYFALALPIGSPYLDRFNLALLQMSELGEIHRLRVKWWHRPE